MIVICVWSCTLTASISDLMAGKNSLFHNSRDCFTVTTIDRHLWPCWIICSNSHFSMVRNCGALKSSAILSTMNEWVNLHATDTLKKQSNINSIKRLQSVVHLNLRQAFVLKNSLPSSPLSIFFWEKWEWKFYLLSLLIRQSIILVFDHFKFKTITLWSKQCSPFPRRKQTSRFN